MGSHDLKLPFLMLQKLRNKLTTDQINSGRLSSKKAEFFQFLFSVVCFSKEEMHLKMLIRVMRKCDFNFILHNFFYAKLFKKANLPAILKT